MINKTLIFFKRLYQLPQYLSKIEKGIVLFLSGIILITTALYGFEKFFVKKIPTPAFGGTFIEGGVGEIRTLIPILKQNETEKDISKLIFSSLVKENEKREMTGDLAEKWEMSPDGKRYTFYLREAKWQDGVKLTADDVLFTLSLILNPETKSPFIEAFKEVEIKKIDDKTVSFDLKTPFAPFLSSLTVPVLPKHLLSQVSPEKLANSPFAKKPIGSGPFKLTKITQQREETSVTLKANRDYYLKKPYLNKFIFKIYKDKEEVLRAFSKKQILGFLDGGSEQSGGYKIILPQYKAVFFNLDSPNLDKTTRKALVLATDKQEILDNIKGVKQIDSPILPGFLGYKEGTKSTFDLEKAKSILVKSKITNKTLTLLTSQSEENQKVTEILKKQWEMLGLQINLVVLSNSLFEKEVASRNYDLLLTGINQKADPDPYPFWHSSQASETGLNLSSFKNKEVDRLLVEARQSADQNFRREKYERFIDIIQNEAPAIFLYQPIYFYRVSGIVKGVGKTEGVVKSDRFWNIENWYINTKMQISK